MANIGYIQITRECNQNCRFCSNPPTGQVLDLETGRRLLEEYRERGFTGVIFTGGEPTLSPMLPELIAFATELGLPARVITNAQKIADPEFFRILHGAGLRLLNISMYSVKDDVQVFLTGNPDSPSNIRKALEIAGGLDGMQTVINTVINKYNSDHLSENLRWLIKYAPFVRHVVWNNLDPRNSKVAENPDTVARLNDFQLELYKAVMILTETGRTCRVERVPLCYMAEFEHLSTETRKIVKREATTTYFLDTKGLFSQDTFSYGKSGCCGACFLNEICAGLFEMDVFYRSEELYACFVEKEKIISKILEPEKNTPQNKKGRRAFGI